MNEMYQDLVEKYIPTIREGAKYGIYFLITAETPGSIKMKVVQSCKNALCLQMNNESAYRDVLGRTGGMTPSQALGRGLFRTDEVCEFQTATIAKDEQFYNFIKPYIEELKTKGYAQAPEIYVMPEII